MSVMKDISHEVTLQEEITPVDVKGKISHEVTRERSLIEEEIVQVKGCKKTMIQKETEGINEKVIMEETMQDEDLEQLVEQHQEQYMKHRSQSDATQGMSQRVVFREEMGEEINQGEENMDKIHQVENGSEELEALDPNISQITDIRKTLTNMKLAAAIGQYDIMQSV